MFWKSQKQEQFKFLGFYVSHFNQSRKFRIPTTGVLVNIKSLTKWDCMLSDDSDKAKKIWFIFDTTKGQ